MDPRQILRRSLEHPPRRRHLPGHRCRRPASLQPRAAGCPRLLAIVHRQVHLEGQLAHGGRRPRPQPHRPATRRRWTGTRPLHRREAMIGNDARRGASNGSCRGPIESIGLTHACSATEVEMQATPSGRSARHQARFRFSVRDASAGTGCRRRIRRDRPPDATRRSSARRSGALRKAHCFVWYDWQWKDGTLLPSATPPSRMGETVHWDRLSQRCGRDRRLRPSVRCHDDPCRPSFRA